MTKKAAKKAAKKAVKKTAKKTSQKASKKVIKKTAKKAIKQATSDENAGPRIGDKVKDFTAVSTGGQSFKLSEHSEKIVVLYFYPKDATPGCTIEGHEFTKLMPHFERHNTVVYGISRDSLKSHEKFKEKECFSFDLLSDEDEAICKIFDVIKTKNMYGKMVLGVERSTYVIKNGKVAALWRKVKAEGHAAEVLEVVKKI